MNAIWAALFLATSSLQAGEDVKVSWLFGRIPDGENRVVRSAAIPWKIGTKYGYEVEISSLKPSIVVKEELVLPERATWKTTGTRGNSPLVSNEKSKIVDERISTRERTIDVSLPVRWEVNYTIIEGDPEGVHTIRLYVDGKLEREVEFLLYKEGPPENGWKKAILERANAIIVAVAEGDVPAMIHSTYPPLVEMFGGEEQMAEEIAPAMAQMEEGLTEGRRSFSIAEPSAPVSANGKLFSIVPSQMLTTSKDGRARILVKSYQQRDRKAEGEVHGFSGELA